MRQAPGGELRPVAAGFRSPFGLGINLAGDVFATDQQGNWWGTCPLIHVQPGRFYGHADSIPDTRRPDSPVRDPGPLPAGLTAGSPLPQPIFTPATKAASGHDENVSFEVMAAAIGAELAETLRARSLDVYARGAEHAATRGIVLADTKFEWGRTVEGELLLVDEVLTPDSSRFWPAGEIAPGRVPDSFDKQFVRDWLERSGWDKASPPPALPADVVARTREKYLEACRLLTGKTP